MRQWCKIDLLIFRMHRLVAKFQQVTHSNFGDEFFGDGMVDEDQKPVSKGKESEGSVG